MSDNKETSLNEECMELIDAFINLFFIVWSQESKELFKTAFGRIG